MLETATRRDILKTTAALAACALTAERAADAQPGAGAFGRIDTTLRTAPSAGDVPGLVAMAATDRGVVYEGVFGKRRLPDGQAMTRDTVFRVASMVKLITSVAALRRSAPPISRRRTRIPPQRGNSILDVCTVSIMCSCSHREIRRSLPLVQLRLMAQCRQALVT
jgi:Beta-lactamase